MEKQVNWIDPDVRIHERYEIKFHLTILHLIL